MQWGKEKMLATNIFSSVHNVFTVFKVHKILDCVVKEKNKYSGMLLADKNSFLSHQIEPFLLYLTLSPHFSNLDELSF